MTKKLFSFLAPVALVVGATLFASPTSATPGDEHKTTICHATHSASNPYVEITVDDAALVAHQNHQDLEDIIPAPEDGCPGPVTTTTVPVTTTTVPVPVTTTTVPVTTTVPGTTTVPDTTTTVLETTTTLPGSPPVAPPAEPSPPASLALTGMSAADWTATGLLSIVTGALCLRGRRRQFS